MGAPAFDVARHAYAHRGLWWTRGAAPENSLDAFRAAAKAGVGVELDVRMTRDGALVVFHDPTLERMCGDAARIADLTARELERHRLPNGAAIPMLEDALDVLQHHPVLIELKTAENAADLAGRVAQDITGLDQRIAVMSFDVIAVRRLLDSITDRPVGQLIEPRIALGREGVIARAKRAARMGCNFLAPHTTSNPASHNAAPDLPRAAWTVKGLIQLQIARRRDAAPIFEGFSPKVALASMRTI